MTRTISTSAPIADLLGHAGLPRSELARRLGLPQAAIPNAIARGDGVTLRWLVRAAAAAGFRLEIRLVSEKATEAAKKAG